LEKGKKIKEKHKIMKNKNSWCPFVSLISPRRKIQKKKEGKLAEIVNCPKNNYK